MSVRLPLFPLNTVVFPHMPAALRIFEERYREMIRDCQHQGTSFGIVAIREGVEVGPTAYPYEVGTLVQIQEMERLDDGGFNLLVTGASRFRVEELSLKRSYLVGTISHLEDSQGDEVAIPALSRRVGDAFAAYRAALANLDDRPDGEADDTQLPDDPELLSYVVAASLNVEVNRRQELLEEGSTSGRLQQCLRMLRRESVFLEQMLARRDHRIVSVSLN